MKTKLIIVSLFYLLSVNIVAQDHVWIQENANLRESESTSSKVVAKLKQLDKVKFISQGKNDVITGFTDNWYKVENENKKVGYVFGHFTSFKKEGQKKIIAKFTDCEMGDLYHILFDNGAYDFGEGNNNLGKYELCTGDDMEVTGNPKFKNKKFELIINDLFARVCCDPSCEEVCIQKVPTIIKIKLLD